jgi:putative endonuclease
MIRLNPAIRAFAFTHKLNYTSIPYLSFLTNKFNMLFTELKTKATHLIRGESAEEQAHKFLIAKGLKPVCRNYRCKQGELDLIMTDQQTLVIIEVRFRKTDQYGSALESVTRAKQSRIIAATHIYLSSQKTDRLVRFDVIAISGNGNVDWIQNAF